MFRIRTRKWRATLSFLAFLIGILPLLSAVEAISIATDSASADDTITASCNDTVRATFANDSRAGAKRLDIVAETTRNTFLRQTPASARGAIDGANGASRCAPALFAGGDRAPPRFR